MSRTPVEKYHIEDMKGMEGNLAIQAGRRRRGERAGEGKRVTHQVDKTTERHKRQSRNQGRDTSEDSDERTRTYMYMFGLNKHMSRRMSRFYSPVVQHYMTQVSDNEYKHKHKHKHANV